MAKDSKVPSGRRRADTVGRRRASGTVETKTRRDLLERKQIAANVLLAWYLLGAVLVSLGAIFGADLLSTGAEVGRSTTVGGDFTTIGTVVIVLDLLVVAALLYSASKLWKSISTRRIHHIRRFSLVSSMGALSMLVFMAIRQGDAVLSSTVSGGMAFYLVFFAIAALTSYAANRSMAETF